MNEYLVFGRTEYAEPLEYQGTLTVDDEEARRLAVERFGEEWVELTLVPGREVHWVLGEKAEAEVPA
jgi:hypothetical protein